MFSGLDTAFEEGLFVGGGPSFADGSPSKVDDDVDGIVILDLVQGGDEAALRTWGS